MITASTHMCDGLLQINFKMGGYGPNNATSPCGHTKLELNN